RRRDVDSRNTGQELICHLLYALSFQELFRNSAANIGKPEVPARMAVGEPCMIEPQAMQNRCLEIMDVHFIFDNIEAEVVGFTDRLAALYSAAGHPHTKCQRMMIASFI